MNLSPQLATPETKHNAPSPPRGWRSAALQEVAILQRGRFSPRPRNDPRYYGGPYPFIQTGDVESSNGYIQTHKQTLNEHGLAVSKMFKAGTLVISIAANIGSIGILTYDCCMPDSLVGITARDGIADNGFLYYALLHRKQDLQKLAPAMAQANLRLSLLAPARIDFPPLSEQRRIAGYLKEQFQELQNARTALLQQELLIDEFIDSLLRHSLLSTTEVHLGTHLLETTVGIGPNWAEYPVLGATRRGLAPAKEPVGKQPERYKPVRPGTIFYNPMRILLGSIAMIDDGDQEGITSPDYVVMTAVEKKLHPRWFYYWFRSKYGAEFIRSMSRGAVRERLLFKRLAPATIKIPDWTTQQQLATQLLEIGLLKNTIRQMLTSLELLPASLLRQAFQ